MADIDAARELLRDAFTRQIEHVDDLTDGLTDEVAYFRPAPDANTIAWLLWHSARMHDAQLCALADLEQVWFREGWVDRFDLDLPRDAHGYGQTPEEVAKVRAPADLARVVDPNWSPPVTASARLVSIIDDAAQHLGQAAYIRGIAH